LMCGSWRKIAEMGTAQS